MPARIFISLMLLAAYGALQGQPFSCGQPLPSPSFSAAQKSQLDSQLAVAQKVYQADPRNAEAIIWLGRRQGYLGDYDKAIATFTQGIALHPGDARMYRHRGHRYITIRCFDKAIADFEKAAALVKGKPDETEPDGQPNAYNIPVSTLQQNIYYHLGLAWFCKGDIAEANKAWQQCYDLSNNEDSRISAANWLYLTHRLLGHTQQADDLLKTILPDTKLLENQVYLDILMLHKNKPTPQQIVELQGQNADVQSATYLYGCIMYLHLNGYKAEAAAARQRLLAGNQWASFGYIAAEAGLR